MHHKYSWCS